ncbi:FG-GAP-like repeat-containing protein [Mucilaginibacter angelicae]|uniref:FG-GAP-like repeat-containing protein n=1 Tax=Mucilaginibacter angelicae TaxID=869718 RepID=A0ABV6LHP2_9SPHI
MNKFYALLSLLFFIACPSLLSAQTWKPFGADEEISAPSLGFTSSNIIAISPDGTPYIAFTDNTNNNTITVKKYDGKRWVQVGITINEGYYSSDPALAFSTDGTPYLAYVPSIADKNIVTVTIRKLVGDNWARVGYPIGTGIYPSLAVDPNNVLYSGFSVAYGGGLAVRKFTNTWENAGDLDNVSGSPLTYNKIAVAADGTLYAAYAAIKNRNKVSVKKLVAGKWQLVGTDGFSNAGANNVTMALTADATPYVAYQDSTAGSAAVVQQFKNGTWTVVSPTGLSKGAANYINMAIAPDGTPYLAFCDAGDKNKPVVKKLSGGNWTSVGPAYLPADKANYTSIAISKNGTPYLTYSDYDLGAKAVVKMFTNGQWTNVGASNVSIQSSNNVILKVAKTGATYVAFNDAFNNGKVSVKQYLSGAWQYVGLPTLSQAGVFLTDLDMDLAPDGTPYVIYRDSSQYSCVVKKYNGTAWVDVGSNIARYGGIFFKITIAPNGTPYIAYSDTNYGGLISVQKFSNGSWTFVGKAAFSAGIVSNVNIAVDKNNVPYVAYLDVSSNKPNAKRFNGTTWVTMGAENFTHGAVRDINLVIGANGTPYMAFYDISAEEIIVNEFSNNSWQVIGGPTGSFALASIPKMQFNPAGQLYLAFLQSNSVDNYTNGQLLKLNQGTWADAGSNGMVPYTGTNHSIAFAPNGDPVYAYTNGPVYVRTKTVDSQAAPPVVNTILPTVGSIGTVITINGYNFSNVSAVKIGTSDAASFTVVSPTTITATLGKGATGPVSVTTPNGTAAFGQFTYTAPQPVINSFSPFFGDVNSTVTIKGKNFSTTAANNLVYLGAVTAEVITATDSILTVKVPVGATAAPLTVTVNQLTAFASGVFNVTFKSQNTFTPTTFAVKQNVGSVTQASAVSVKDMDNDGKPDVIVTGGGTAVLSNTSTKNNLSFKTNFNRDQTGEYLTTCDLDGDGKAELVMATGVAINTYKNNSTPGNTSFLTYGQVIQPADYSFEASVGDVDGDGRPDILSISNGGFNIALFRNGGTEKNYTYFDDAIILTNDSFPLGANLADIDGDGKPDVIVILPDYSKLDAYGYISVFKNTSTIGRVSFTPVVFPARLYAGKNTGQPIIADMDNDGRPEIIVPNTKSNTISVFKNTSTKGGIIFATGVEFATGTSPSSIAVADLDGDSLPDIAVANRSSSISVLKNTSTTSAISLAAKVDYNTNYQPGSIVAADLDGDQAPELIVSNYLGNNATIFKNSIIQLNLPNTNFTVSTVSATCKGSNNGSVNIDANQAFTYTAALTGNGLTKTLPFTTKGAFNNLPAGTYNLCITMAEQSDYKQCYDVVIVEPKDLTLYSTVNTENKTVNLALTGGSVYNINLNGTNYTTTNNSINLPLNAGNNKLSISTDKECQGIIQKLINLSGIISPYPVPFQNTLNVNIGLTPVSNVSVQLYAVSDGRPVYNKQFTNQAGVLQLDVTAFKTGVYTLHLTLDGNENVFKVIKQ